MTEIKISFSKIGVEKIYDSSMPANLKALKLKVIATGDLSKISEKIPPQADLEEIKLGFWDGAEDEIYNKLLDDDNVSFELSWGKKRKLIFQ